MDKAKDEIKDIELNLIEVKRNYRITFDQASIFELAASIKESGVVQPIIVRRQNNTTFPYALVIGQRRLKAAFKAGLVTVPAIIRAVDQRDILLTQLIENTHRENVPLLEEVEAISVLQAEFDFEPKEIARRLGKPQKYVIDLLTLSDASDALCDAIAEKKVTKTVAVMIADLPESDQVTATRALERTTNRVTPTKAKTYIERIFPPKKPQEPKETKTVAPKREKKKTAATDLGNWKTAILTFDCREFSAFKGIVKDRTDVTVWAEAADIVIRDRGKR